MIFSCNVLDLADALSKVSHALPLRRISPVFEGIKIEALNNTVKLTATDNDFTIVKTIRADVKMAGEVLVPGKLLIDYITKLNAESDIEISDEQDNLIISYMDNNSKLKLIDINDYPVIKDYEYKYRITILQKDFKDLINKTAFSAANDDNRPSLKGCLLKVSEEGIQSVALDGYRMAICKKALPGDYEEDEINIPSKDLLKISKLLKDDDDSVDLCIANKKLVIDLNDMKIISTPLEGFLNYKASIPHDFETIITVNTKMLSDAIDRVSTFSKYEKSYLIKLEVKNNLLTINSNTEIGNSSENISVINDNGKDLTVNYNCKYISDCLKNIEDEYIKIKMNFTYPSIITGIDDSEYMYLILPVRFR